MTKSAEQDKKVLHSLGYAQELSRRMSGFSNFAISFSIICILAGGISSFYAAFNSTGGVGAFIGWLVGGFFSMMVALSMGQMPPLTRQLVVYTIGHLSSLENSGVGLPHGSTYLACFSSSPQ